MQVKPRRNRRSRSQEKGFLKHLSPQHTWDHVSHKGCSEQMRPWQTAYREQVSNVNIIPSPRNTRHSGQHHDRGTTTCNKQPAPGEWFTEPAQQTARPRTLDVPRKMQAIWARPMEIYKLFMSVSRRFQIG